MSFNDGFVLKRRLTNRKFSQKNVPSRQKNPLNFEFFLLLTSQAVLMSMCVCLSLSLEHRIFSGQRSSMFTSTPQGGDALITDLEVESGKKYSRYMSRKHETAIRFHVHEMNVCIICFGSA